MTGLALDIGQTGIRARIFGSSGITDRDLPGFAFGSDLVEVVARAAEQVIGNEPFTVISCGCTGVYGQPPEVPRSRFEGLASRVILADDALTSYLACLGNEAGVVAAAGTGLVVLGISQSGARRVDGRGALLGDEGSGWWIGRRAVIELLSLSESGRATGGTLRYHLEESVGPLEALPQRLATEQNPVALVASLAAPTARAARDGDPLALAIYREAASLIAAAIVAAASDIPPGSSLNWAVVGGIGNAMDLLDPVLTKVISNSYPRNIRHTTTRPGIEGAVMLAELPTLSRYGALVSHCQIDQ